MDALRYFSVVLTGVLESINVSRGGVPKTAVFEALISESGLDGDRQADPRFHGGPDRAVVLFSSEVINALKAEGHPIAPGTIGENLTVSGIEWRNLTPGSTVVVGPVRLLVTKYATPCYKIAGAFLDRSFRRVDQSIHPGFSRVCARVVEAGLVRPGDPVHVVR